MKRFRPLGRRLACPLLSLSLIIAALTIATPNSDAQHELKSLKEGLSIQLQTDIDGETAEKGDIVKGILVEDYVYNGMTLNAGTKFSGTVNKTKDSHHLARPGYIVLHVNQATLPNGHTMGFQEDDNHNKPIYHEEANTPKRIVVKSLPFFLVNAATTLPLRVASTVPGLPIGFASKMALGVAKEYWRKDKDPNRPNRYKVGYGMLVGSGIPGIMFIGAKRPEPELKSGDTVDIYLDPDGLEELFKASQV